ncbi:Integral membrane protein OS=Streptomyces microflavus OX=1919 GN=Smic_50590 PE=4 SV=1 [Streptomyces microflavus]
MYWAVSSLRAQPKSPAATDRTTVGAVTGAEAPPPGDGGGPPVATTPQSTDRRPQTTAAISGLVTALLALIIVITTYTVQLVYRDYYTCVNDALTKTGAVACNDQLPKPLEPLFGVKE